MRFRFILSETWNSLKRNVSMIISVMLVTFISFLFIGVSGLMQAQITAAMTLIRDPAGLEPERGMALPARRMTITLARTLLVIRPQCKAATLGRTVNSIPCTPWAATAKSTGIKTTTLFPEKNRRSSENVFRL